MDGPITVVTPGSDVQSATGANVIFSSKNPFTKLDTSNIVSFQTISILFDHEPPQPANSIGAHTQTLIYQFPHGYNYIPSIWLMWQNDSPEFPALPSANSSATTYYPFGDDTSSQAELDILSGESPANDGTNLAFVTYYNGTSYADTTFAWLTTLVDSTNVYIYVMKYASTLVGGDAIPLYLAGVTLDIRCYVFTEPGSTSTY
jgi:hypothetical protein